MLTATLLAHGVSAGLTADKIKALMEVIVRVHLGWLVVWGNIFGGLIGFISSVAGAGDHL